VRVLPVHNVSQMLVKKKWMLLYLEGFVVRHPVDRKLVRDDVCLVEDEDKRQLGLVQDAAGIEHVAHERGRVGRAGCVNDVGDNGGE